MELTVDITLPQYQKQHQIIDKTGTLNRGNRRHYHSSIPWGSDLLTANRLCMSCIREDRFTCPTPAWKMATLMASVKQGQNTTTSYTHVRND